MERSGLQFTGWYGSQCWTSWTPAPWETEGPAGWWWSHAARGIEQEALGSPELEEAAGLQESSGAESDAAGAPPGDVVLLHMSSPGESVLGRSPELRKAHQV